MPQCLATKTMPRMVKVDVLLEGEDIMRAVEGLVEDEVECKCAICTTNTHSDICQEINY